MSNPVYDRGLHARDGSSGETEMKEMGKYQKAIL
jgi:hypothetical protein